MTTRLHASVATAALLLTTPALAFQSEAEQMGEEGDRGGGPGQVQNQMELDEKVRQVKYRYTDLQRGLGPYFDFKTRLAENHGFNFGTDYTALYMKASRSPGEDEAASGIYRLYGSWDLIGRDTPNVGKFVFKVEHRHRYTDIPPFNLGLATGYAGIWGGPFKNDGLRWTNLYWHQRFAEGKGNVLVGFLDMTDYFDVYALANPWTSFLNLAFSTGSAAVPLPGDASLGAVAGGFVNDNVWITAGINDINADPTDPFGGFETFFDESEYLYFAEVGYTSTYERRYFDNMHLTVWGVDEKTATGDPNGWGINASYSEFVNDTYMPFVRGGWTEDAGSLLSTSISAGMGWYVYKRADLCGFAVNWGEPNETTFGSGLDDQYTFETFYRIQMSPNFALTPDLQFIVDPALNPSASSTWVIGLRARLAI